MNVAARISELKAIVEAARVSAMTECAGLGPDAFKNRGQQLAIEVGPQYREMSALKGKIVSLTSHDGRLLLATDDGVFEIVGDELRFIDLKALPRKD